MNPTSEPAGSTTSKTPPLAALIRSLELTGEVLDDFYGEVFARYFELCPDSRALMSHTDTHMRGRMLEQVVALFMNDDLESLDTYFAFEAANHESYGAEPHMYENLFAACQQVVASANAQDWSDAAQTDWQTQSERLLAAMHKHCTTSATQDTER